MIITDLEIVYLISKTRYSTYPSVRRMVRKRLPQIGFEIAVDINKEIQLKSLDILFIHQGYD